MKNILLVVLTVLVVTFATLFYIERAKAPEAPTPTDNIPTTQDQVPEQTGPYTVVSEVNEVSITLESPDLREPLDECIFEIQGQVTGAWFFEGDFPVEIYTSTGEFLNTEIARAADEWMTTDDVDFGVQINCLQASCPLDTRLRFVRNNPSGLPENDDYAEVDITVPATCGTVDPL